ncbi:hypothetical protein ACUN8C_00405 [Kushneria sp. Sum13]|uniref:hypothetical protein n=1 Tax=Kushneria sp. Sum13 TaxID=3459196 RepID=UPI00404655F9
MLAMLRLTKAIHGHGVTLMLGLTSREMERLVQRDIHPVCIEGNDCLVRMHGRVLRCTPHDLHRLAAPSLRERMRGQINRRSSA